MPSDSTRLDIIDGLAHQSSLRLEQGRCVRLRGGAPCDQCSTTCPVGLPPVDNEGVPADDNPACLRCGACAAACPTHAIRLEGLGYNSWVRDIAKGWPRDGGGPEVLSAHCSAVPCTGDSMSVGCLRAWDPSVVLLAWSRQITDVVMTTGNCADCPIGQGAGSFAWLDRLERLGRSLSTPRSVRLLEGASPTPSDQGRLQVQVDRRRFFDALRQSARDAVAGSLRSRDSSAPPAPEHERGAGEPSLPREIAVTSLRALALDGDISALDRAIRGGSGAVSTTGPKVDERLCDACGDCSTFCPVGALRLIVHEGEVRLSLSSSTCVGCGLCQTLCRSSAIHMRDRGLSAVLREKRVRLARFQAEECAQCGAKFAGQPLGGTCDGQPASGPDLCPACRRSRERYRNMY